MFSIVWVKHPNCMSALLLPNAPKSRNWWPDVELRFNVVYCISVGPHKKSSIDSITR